MLSVLPKDVVSIIYRLIHRDALAGCFVEIFNWLIWDNLHNRYVFKVPHALFYLGAFNHRNCNHNTLFAGYGIFHATKEHDTSKYIKNVKLPKNW